MNSGRQRGQQDTGVLAGKGEEAPESGDLTAAIDRGHTPSRAPENSATASSGARVVSLASRKDWLLVSRTQSLVVKRTGSSTPSTMSQHSPETNA